MGRNNWSILLATLMLLFAPLLPANMDGDTPVALTGAEPANIMHESIVCASPETESPIQVAVTCFKSGERTSGMYKICYYDCLGSTVAITIDATDLCPLSISR